MAKHHQLLSSYQQGIVSRFYQHRDSVLSQRLAELVSELYLADEGPKKDKLWKSARDTMLKAGAAGADVSGVCDGRDVAALARIVTELQSAKPAASRRPAQPPPGDDF